MVKITNNFQPTFDVTPVSNTVKIRSLSRKVFCVADGIFVLKTPARMARRIFQLLLGHLEI